MWAKRTPNWTAFRHTPNVHPDSGRCQVSHNSRVPVTQLPALVTRRGTSLSEVAAALGMSRSAFHELRKHPDGIARHHAEAIATYLGVPLSALSAPVVRVVGADDTTAAMLATPEVAAVAQRAADAMADIMRAAMADTVAATLHLIASGTVSAPPPVVPDVVGLEDLATRRETARRTRAKRAR
jgi:transcriptional regulator with XRE-family HTH domain